MKNIEKQLKKESQNVVPEIFDSVMQKAEEQNLFEDNRVAAQQAVLATNSANKTVFSNVGQKFIYAILAAVLIIAISVTIILPNVIKNPVPFDNIGLVQLTVTDFYGLGATTATQLINSGSAKLSDSISDKVENQSKEFEKYFALLEGYLSGDFVKTSAEINADENYSQYHTKLNVETQNILGVVATYSLYYNETLVKSSSDDNEDESYYTLDGVFVNGDVYYRLKGLRSVEAEDDETEETLKLEVYNSSDNDYYVEVEQEISVENGEKETSYVYRIFNNGEISEETAVAFETKTNGNETSCELELEFRKGLAKGKYNVKRENSDEADIKVEFDLEGEKNDFTIKLNPVENGKHEYIYNFNRPDEPDKNQSDPKDDKFGGFSFSIPKKDDKSVNLH
ncbi:MAG: hypothetical protein ACI4M6_01890 [Christensenellaceae bacterium]